MIPWSPGGVTAPRAGGCGCGSDWSPSSERIARLMIRPKAITISTPARITVAGMANSLSGRRRPFSSAGGMAKPRLPLRYP